MSDFDFEKDVRIDPERLDEEWLRQPELMARYGEMLADAKDETRRAHQRVKLKRSELILKAKSGQAEDEIGVKKPSDSVCEAYYRTHPEYREAEMEWLEAQKEEDAIQQAVYAIGSRRAALEHLVRLLSQEYFSAPIEPHDLSSFSYEDFTKKAAEKKKQKRDETTKRMVSKRRRRKTKEE